MNRLHALLFILALLILPVLWTTESATREQKTGRAPAAAPPIVGEQQAAQRKAAFRRGHDLLTKEGVPFDPDELLKPKWKQKLKTTLDQMPELRLARQGESKLNGLQMAHTLYLPDNIQLTGDTVILARRLVFLGRDVVIKGNHDIHIFTIEETQLADNSAGGRGARAGLVKASLRANQNVEQGKGVLGHITIDTSGPGRDEWLPTKGMQQTARLSASRRQSHHAANSAFQNQDGAAGSDGTTGSAGNPGQNGGNGSNGPAGTCTGNINGADGGSGSSGSSGGNAGNGGNGNDGQPGGNVSFTAQIGQSYTVSVNGGRGGNGGPGGSGGQGGSAGNGGSGGNGAACSPCTIGHPSTSNGGSGGEGGFGADGGDGGNGGNGGRGGDGGSITIEYPVGYNTSNLNTSANGGSGGNSGEGGFGAQGGSNGSGGTGGSGNRGFACSGSGNQGQNGGSGSPGDSGDSGNAGTPGGNGDPGTEDIHEGGGGGGGCTFDWECECECICYEGLCSFASPIVIDVLGDGFDLTNGSNGVHFDLNADGVSRGLAWTSVSTDDAWLTLDRNNNGLIDNGTELFGDVTQQPASQFPNGFAALAVFDKAENGGNGDGKITQQDSVFFSLRLWRDANHNGTSEPSELHGLPELGLIALDLDYKKSKRIDQYGNEFRYRAKVKDQRGAQLGRWAWDVFLVSPLQP